MSFNHGFDRIKPDEGKFLLSVPSGLIRGRFVLLIIFPIILSLGQHLSKSLCHDENQKVRIKREEQRNGKGSAQRRKTGLLRWQVHRIRGKIHSFRFGSAGIGRNPCCTKMRLFAYHHQKATARGTDQGSQKGPATPALSPQTHGGKQDTQTAKR